MKKSALVPVVLLIPVLTVFAQNVHLPEEQSTDSRFPGRQNMDRRSDLDQDRTDTRSEPPVRLTVEEFLLKRSDLKGKVVELTFDRVLSLKQSGANGYIAVVSYGSVRLTDGVNVVVPDEGLNFFQELADPKIHRRKTIYVRVMVASTVRALGTHYSGGKPDKESYSW